MDLPDEDLSADMFELADELLTLNGFEHYEIANYAKPGYRSRHNSGYWKRDGYLGIGVAAHSFMREGYGIRYNNPDNLEEYRQFVSEGKLVRLGEKIITLNDAMSEYLYLGLRLSDGVNFSAFECEFGLPLESAYFDAINKLTKLGLLVNNGVSISLTRRGMLLSNQVFQRFII
jgi:oxygen-independent coproporphyrinogen-3 oxidase